MKLANRYRIFSIVMFFAALFHAKGEVESNIVIPELHHTYTFITEGEGESLRISKIKHSEKRSYTAGRVPEECMAYTFYDKITTIDKAKSKGVIPQYLPASDNYIFYDDSRVCLLPVSVEPGKNTDVEFETTITRPGFDPITYVCESYPVRNFSITYRMPVALMGKIDIIEHNLPSNAVVTKEVSGNGKEYVIRVTAKDIPEIRRDAGAPPARRVYPHVQMVGFFKDAGELYANIHSFVNSADPGAEEVTRFARELTEECDTDMERLTVIQDWVRDNIRYVAIEHGDLGFQPDHASEVLRKRFGDCKGSAMLIKSMLNAVGIDGRLVWIGTDAIPDDFTSVPNPSTGNHMIAAAILNDSIYYIDGTVGAAPHNYYSPSIQGKQTIIENGDKPLLHRVPVLAPEASCDSMVMSGALVDGKFVGMIRDCFSGSFKSRFANRYRYADDEKKAKIPGETLMVDRKNASFAALKLFDMEPEEPYGCISGLVKVDKVLTQSGDKLYFNPALFPMLKEMKVKLKDRTNPLRLNDRVRIVRELNLELADDYAVEWIPDDFHFAGDIMDAHVTYRNNDGKVICRFEMVTKVRDVPFDRLKDYNDDITKINKALSQRLQLSKTE